MGRRVGLALGAGGARGFAHIGALLWLREHGIECSCIAGTSMGSIIGAFTAFGYSPQALRRFAGDIRWSDLVRYLQFSLRGSSVFTWSRIHDYLEERLQGRDIEKLRVPFACVATDLSTGAPFVFRRGNVVTAVSASSAIPGIFPPVELGDRTLVDGELVDPVPVGLAFDLGAEKVIGISAQRDLHAARAADAGQPGLVRRMDEWVKSLEKTHERVGELAERILGGIENAAGGRRIFDVITDSFSVVTAQILDVSRKRAATHLMIEPDVGRYGAFDFEQAGEIIERGYRACEESAGRIERYLDAEVGPPGAG